MCVCHAPRLVPGPGWDREGPTQGDGNGVQLPGPLPLPLMAARAQGRRGDPVACQIFRFIRNIDSGDTRGRVAAAARCLHRGCGRPLWGASGLRPISVLLESNQERCLQSRGPASPSVSGAELCRLSRDVRLRAPGTHPWAPRELWGGGLEGRGQGHAQRGTLRHSPAQLWGAGSAAGTGGEGGGLRGGG